MSAMTFAEKAALERAIEEIGEIAAEMGYDPPPIHFEVVPAHVIYELGAYALPARYSHWTFGRDYHRQKTSYEYGLSKIYELVFNTDPCQAFLMDVNSLTSHKLTIAHVIGHGHFFKHNACFAPTDKKMVERVRLHRDRIAAYEEEMGWRRVEAFLDAVLCLEWHIDPHEGTPSPLKPTTNAPGEFDDLFPTPAPEPKTRRFPETPRRDLLKFLSEHAPELLPWQRDVLSMLREEMLYFLPQIRTRIMNEGFASLAHERILERYLSESEEIWEFRRLHSSVLSPPPRGQLNPYYVGFQMLKDIERRWNGEAREAEADWVGREQPRPAGEGWKKVFEVCEDESDASFIRKYLTEPLVRRLDMYTYTLDEDDGGEPAWVVESTDWEEVRDALAENLTHFGVPLITVEDGDWKRRGELLLRHAHDGKDLELDEAARTLRALQSLWGRPVHLETIIEEVPTRMSCDSEGEGTLEPIE